MQYEIGSYIVYGGTGVCLVENITEPKMSGIEPGQLYYVLKPLYQDGVIYTPLEGGRVPMRPTVTREEAEELIDSIPEIEAEGYYGGRASEVAEHYKETLRRQDCGELIELTMSIYDKKLTQEKRHHKFGQVDERFMKRAEELLYGEFAVALEMSRDEVPAYIAERVERARRQAKKADK